VIVFSGLLAMCFCVSSITTGIVLCINAFS
jgi:hypothetical protein